MCPMKDPNRENRLKAALRENLKRRKEQLRERQKLQQNQNEQHIQEEDVLTPCLPEDFSDEPKH